MQITFMPYIHNHKTNFSGRKEVREKSENFSNDIIKLSRSKNFNDESIKALAHSYIPNIIFRKKTAQKGDEKDVAGVFIPDFQYGTASKRYGIKSRTIYLRPIKDAKMTKGEFIKTLVHEMTHAFQEDDKDISEVTLMNKSLKFVDEDTANEIMTAAFSTWIYFEDTLLYPLTDSIDNITFENRGTFPYNISINTEKMKECIADIFRDAEKSFPMVDINFIKSHVKLQLQHEAEAYRMGQRTLRKFKKENPRQEDEIIPQLYERISNYIK